MIWSATTLSPLHLAWYWSDVGASLGHNNTKHLGPRSDSARVICSMPLHQPKFLHFEICRRGWAAPVEGLARKGHGGNVALRELADATKVCRRRAGTATAHARYFVFSKVTFKLRDLPPRAMVNGCPGTALTYMVGGPLLIVIAT